jgi:hypothetical protein
MAALRSIRIVEERIFYEREAGRVVHRDRDRAREMEWRRRGKLRRLTLATQMFRVTSAHRVGHEGVTH